MQADDFDRYSQLFAFLVRQASYGLAPDIAAKFAPEDIVQEAMAELAQAGYWPPDLPGAIATVKRRTQDAARRFHAAVRDVARERSIDARLEQSSIALGRLLPAPGPTPSGIVANDEALLAATARLNSLPTIERDTVERHCLHGESYESVGNALGISEKEVANAIRRGLRSLRG